MTRRGSCGACGRCDGCMKQHSICLVVGTINSFPLAVCPRDCSDIDCPADPRCIAATRLKIKHECFKDALVEIENVATFDRCKRGRLLVSAELVADDADHWLNQLKPGACCEFKYELWVDVYETVPEEPTDENPEPELPDVCTQLLQIGYLTLDWSLM